MCYCASLCYGVMMGVCVRVLTSTMLICVMVLVCVLDLLRLIACFTLVVVSTCGDIALTSALQCFMLTCVRVLNRVFFILYKYMNVCISCEHNEYVV